MKLFAVMYVHAHLAVAMSLWPGATLPDCRKINAEYAHDLDDIWIEKHLDYAAKMVDPFNKKHHLKRSDVRLTCEWHANNPISGD